MFFPQICSIDFLLSVPKTIHISVEFKNVCLAQVVIVPIWKKGDEKSAVMEAVSSVQNTLKEAGIRVKVDDSELRTPGWKFNFYEMKGVPIRLEIGPRDVTNKSVVISRRDIPGKQGKEFGVSMDPSILVDHIKGRLVEIQASLLQKAIAFRDRYYLFTLNDLS
jgi:prolyl-tRNA synthetase